MAESELSFPKGVKDLFLLFPQALKATHTQWVWSSVYLLTCVIHILKFKIKYFSTCPWRLTYGQQLLTLAGLAESQYAVYIDAGFCLVAVLNKAEGLEVESGDTGQAVACHRRSLLHRTANAEQSYLVAKYTCVEGILLTLLLICVSIPSEEVVLFSLWDVVSSRGGKAVI